MQEAQEIFANIDAPHARKELAFPHCLSIQELGERPPAWKNQEWERVALQNDVWAYAACLDLMSDTSGRDGGRTSPWVAWEASLCREKSSTSFEFATYVLLGLALAFGVYSVRGFNLLIYL